MIVTDDTPGESIKVIAEKFASRLNLIYSKNAVPLGSPANWNEALKKASGSYVLLLHHDDRLANEDSLMNFLNPFINDDKVDFVFGRYNTIDKLCKGSFHPRHFDKYYKEPLLLIAGQTIGPPSNVMLKKSSEGWYDERYKWIVDIEFYVRLFQAKRKFYYVDTPLVQVGIHEGQVSNECVDNAQVLIYENVLFASEHLQKMNNLLIFDFYWRLLRNHHIIDVMQIVATGVTEAQIPSFIKKIIAVQKRVPPALLKMGVVSKILMTGTYLFRQ